jgi:hypothetical protein
MLVEVEVESTPLSPPLSSVEVPARVEKESSNSELDSYQVSTRLLKLEVLWALNIQVSSLQEPRSSLKIQVSSF